MCWKKDETKRRSNALHHQRFQETKKFFNTLLRGNFNYIFDLNKLMQLIEAIFRVLVLLVPKLQETQTESCCSIGRLDPKIHFGHFRNKKFGD